MMTIYIRSKEGIKDNPLILFFVFIPELGVSSRSGFISGVAMFSLFFSDSPFSQYQNIHIKWSALASSRTPKCLPFHSVIHTLIMVIYIIAVDALGQVNRSKAVIQLAPQESLTSTNRQGKWNVLSKDATKDGMGVWTSNPPVDP